ncbi:hypothetical protein RJ639_009150 [Escallonia herrerae]|uniref:Uncharacterized protein n=1 Tax=Escallonia herrerae TaxID=1293975 RepID=A0AA88VS38_9ASTE|nr:hypothetical protein RJ639_009150 [Escallonia herrerae]
MSLSFSISIFRRASLTWRPRILHAARWTVLLTTMVAVASFAAEIAFISAVLPSSSSPSRSCCANGFNNIPLDASREMLCLPVHLVKRSTLDFLVPIVFEALVVAGSACMIRALGLCHV